MWPLAMQALALLRVGICRTGAHGAPLRVVHCVCGDLQGLCPLAISEGGFLEQRASAKQQSRPTSQYLRVVDYPLGQPPLEVPPTTLQWEARTVQPGECSFFQCGGQSLCRAGEVPETIRAG